MDHKEQHHEHHQHEREAHKQARKHRHRSDSDKTAMPIHPMWMLVVGIVLALAAILVWTFAV